MTLDDAIKHCQQVANESECECANEHKQLAEWLKELKKFRQEQTNEEWFCGLSTEEKAEFFANVERIDFPVFPSIEDRAKDIVEWLKQPHTEKE